MFSHTLEYILTHPYQLINKLIWKGSFIGTLVRGTSSYIVDPTASGSDY